MKTSKRIFLFAFGVLFFVAQTANAQVTIGSELEPNTGALLDLKQDATSPGANSSKGFNLPRVALSTLNSLSPCATDNDANKKSHTGLTVYNTTSDDNFIPGTYVWNGSSWITSSSRAKRVNVTLTDLGVGKLTNGQNTNIKSFVIPESGYYAINSRVTCSRSSTGAGYFYFYITGNNYSHLLGLYDATSSTPSDWDVYTNNSIVDYFKAGTYYLTLRAMGTSWTHHTSSIFLVKLSD